MDKYNINDLIDAYKLGVQDGLCASSQNTYKEKNSYPNNDYYEESKPMSGELKRQVEDYMRG